jgi:YggT family protein
MKVVGETIYFFGWIFFLLLLFRFVMSWVFMFARDYTPRGIMLIFVEAAYTVTDPPVNLIRRVVPPLRLGGMVLDLSMLILLLFVQLIVIGLIAGTLINM